MSPQGKTSRSTAIPLLLAQRDCPPFWELEQLLSSGFALDDALQELSRRRAEPGEGPAPAPRSQSRARQRASLIP
jgi:hypothetical protein